MLSKIRPFIDLYNQGYLCAEMAEELHLDHSTISVRLKHYKKRFPELFDEAGREKFMELRKKERAAKREERQKNKASEIGCNLKDRTVKGTAHLMGISKRTVYGLGYRFPELVNLHDNKEVRRYKLIKKICDQLKEKSLKEVAEGLSISKAHICNLRRKYPDLFLSSTPSN